MIKLANPNILVNDHFRVLSWMYDKKDSENLVEPNFTGLVANVLAQKYQKPTLILHESEEAWSGSGRNYSNSNSYYANKERR